MWQCPGSPLEPCLLLASDPGLPQGRALPHGNTCWDPWHIWEVHWGFWWVGGAKSLQHSSYHGVVTPDYPSPLPGIGGMHLYISMGKEKGSWEMMSWSSSQPLHSACPQPAAEVCPVGIPDPRLCLFLPYLGILPVAHWPSPLVWGGVRVPLQIPLAVDSLGSVFLVAISAASMANTIRTEVSLKTENCTLPCAAVSISNKYMHLNYFNSFNCLKYLILLKLLSIYYLF